MLSDLGWQWAAQTRRPGSVDIHDDTHAPQQKPTELTWNKFKHIVKSGVDHDLISVMALNLVESSVFKIGIHGFKLYF